MQLPFASQSYQAHSGPLDAQRCVNFYTEKSPPEAKSPVPVYGCPGIAPFTTAGVGPIQGWVMMNDVLYVVSGQAFYSIASDGTATELGTTLVTGLVSIDTNGTQIVWVDGATGWWWSEATGVQQITDPNFYPADVVVYFDTYFVFNRSGTKEFFISPSEAVIPFNGAMFASKESTADNLISIVNTHEMLLLFGEERTEIWFDAGNAPPSFPFQPYYGAFIQRGIMTPLAVCLEDNTTFFLGDDGIFYRLEFTLPLRVSTHAVEHAWQSYSTMKGAWCYSYTVEGHKWVTITFPSAPATWVYDIASGLWHERESWAGGDESTTILRYRANWVGYAYNRNLVFDSLSGQIGQLNFNEFLEFGATMRGLVAAPPIQADRQRMFMRRFELDVESGVGVPYAPAYTTIAYDIAGANITLPPTFLQTAAGLIGLVSSFSAFLFSAWVYLPDVGLPEGFWFSNQTSDATPATPGLQIGIFNDQTSTPQITVRAFDSTGAQIMLATFDLTTWTAWTLFMISADITTQVIQCWINNGGADTALTPASVTWNSGNAIAPLNTQPWHVTPGGGTLSNPEYQFTPVNYGHPPGFDYVLTLWPTSNNYFLGSVWIENPAALSNAQVAWVLVTGEWPWSWAVGNGNSTIVFAWQASSYSAFSNITWSIPAAALTGAVMHVVVSIDTTRTASTPFQCYINGVAASLVSETYVAAGIFASSGNAYLAMVPVSGQAFCTGDWYVTAPASFFDLTIPANLAKFINPNTGYPVNLGSHGQTPTGTDAQMLLQWAGVPTNAPVNNGTSGGLSISGGMVPVACAAYPPLVDGIAEIANLFFANTASLFDLTVTANRRLFVTSSGEAVFSNGDGSSILGAKPPVFLTRVLAQPVSAFAANAGSGGPFTIQAGSLTAPATNPIGAPYQEQLYAGDNQPPGADPQIRLDWSDDGGRTWSLLKKWRSMGKIGEYRKRLRWLKMGQARQRILRLEVTDPVRRNLIGNYLDVEQGQK